MRLSKASLWHSGASSDGLLYQASTSIRKTVLDMDLPILEEGF